MSINKYDFSDIDPDEGKVDEDEDPRLNFRITKCCGNCRYFFYTGVKSRRGYCKLLNTEFMNVGSFKKSDISEEAEKYGWPPVHSTNVCDRHMLRSQKYSIEMVSEYTGVKFEFDGTQDFTFTEEEDDDFDEFD